MKDIRWRTGPAGVAAARELAAKAPAAALAIANPRGNTHPLSGYLSAIMIVRIYFYSNTAAGRVRSVETRDYKRPRDQAHGAPRPSL